MTEGVDVLLRGWTVELAPAPAAHVAIASRLLGELGAKLVLSEIEPAAFRVVRPSGVERAQAIADWRDEGAFAAALERYPGGGARWKPQGCLLTAYAGIRLAADALAPRPSVLALDDLLGELLASMNSAAAETNASQLIRCKDGWAVIRCRDENDVSLLHAMVGPLSEAGLDETVEAGRLVRLLIGPVRPPPASPPPSFTGVFDGERAVGDGVRVVDWTPLWAGPWTAHRLQRDGASVSRIEHPLRPDGLLSWDGGRRWWKSLNDAKRLLCLDATDAEQRNRLDREFAQSDILLTGMTPRALHSLGYTDAWRLGRAPGLLHVEIVSFEEPWADAAGTGDQAAAQAGLLWRQDAAPVEPHAWPDPMLGAAALALCRAWLASTDRRGGRIRLTLEGIAALALSEMPTASDARHTPK